MLPLTVALIVVLLVAGAVLLVGPSTREIGRAHV